MNLYNFLKICNSEIKEFLLTRIIALTILKHNDTKRKIIYGELKGFLAALYITNIIKEEQKCLLWIDIEYTYECGDLPF